MAVTMSVEGIVAMVLALVPKVESPEHSLTSYRE